MKKYISLLFVFAVFIISAVSCGKTPAAHIQTEKYFASETYHSAVETESRVLLVQSGALYYYSKADGQSYRFCFNPLCQHTVNDNCTSILFNRSDSMSSTVAYSNELSRFFIVRGQKIYSMSFDASDLKLECSLGEKGDISEFLYHSNDIYRIRSYSSYIYFIYKNNKTGHNQVFRLNVKNSKLEEMTSGKKEWAIGYEIADGYIYLKMLDEDNIIRYYTTDMDFNNKKQVKNPIDDSDMGVSMGLYDGKFFYSKGTDGIYSIDPISDTKTRVCGDFVPEMWDQIMAVDKNGICLIKQRKAVAGKKLDSRTGELIDITTDWNNIVKVSFNGQMEYLLDMPKIQMQNMNFVDDGAIVFCSNVYLNENKKGVTEVKSGVFLHFDLDENGKFVNPRPIGNYAEDEELIEYLKGKS